MSCILYTVATLLAVLCRPSTLSLAALSSHIDKAVNLVLLSYAGDVDLVLLVL